MYATLLSVIVALVLGHLVKPLARAVRRHGWWRRWLTHLDAFFDEHRAWRSAWGPAIALVPVVVGMLALQVLAALTPWNLGLLLLGVVVLFYSWGPRDLDVDVAEVLNAPDLPARRRAAQALSPGGAKVSLEPRALVSRVFTSAVERWFGVLFWFGLLGPVGALVYRLLVEAATGSAAAALPAATARGASTLKAWLDWLPAQLLTFTLAIVGDAGVVREAWRRHGGADFNEQADFLAAAGRASVRDELADEAQDLVDDGVADVETIARELGPLPELRDAMSLLWRCLMVWLLVLAAFVLAGWFI